MTLDGVGSSDPLRSSFGQALDITPLRDAFQIFAQLYVGKQTVVLKALRRADQLPVILKVTLAEFPAAATIARFRLEHDLLRQLDHPHIIRSLDFVRIGTRAGLILEERNAIPLPELLARRQVSLADKLAIALAAAQALHAVHRGGIIHFDVNPANLIVCPTTLVPTLIDFGEGIKTAAGVPVRPGSNAGGNLHYMAPERSGRRYRLLDHRCDLYSFGVVLFELVTGQLPFAASDAMTLIHLHGAKTAPMAHEVNRDVTVFLSKVIEKLLAKEPDARYQTAASLCDDLHRCLRQLQQGVQVDHDEVAVNDFGGRIESQNRLYGREPELQQMHQWLSDPAQQAAHLVLISGEAGVGKSSLMHELRLTMPGLHFAFGKFDQVAREQPYKGITDALTDGLRPLLASSAGDVQAWRQRFLADIAGNAAVLTPMIPELGRLLGPQAAIPLLDDGQNRNRFALAMKTLVRCLPPSGSRLVLFLDDLQWADSASFSLLADLVSDAAALGLVIVLAYRPHEVGPHHPLLSWTRARIEAGTRMQQLPLAGLNQADIECLLAETFRKPRADCGDMARLVLTTTRGNPLFVNELLKKLVSSQQLVYDSEQRAWVWDLSAISQLKLGEDVAELIVQRLQQVSPGCQDALKTASCLGALFSLADLALLSRLDVRQLGALMVEAVEAQLLFPADGDYHLLSSLGLDTSRVDPALGGWTFRFAHDRVQLACRQQVSEHEAAAFHLVIGRAAAPRVAEGGSAAALFTAVAHLNAARSLLTSPAERRELIHMNYRAGLDARAAVAYGAARGYFQTGLELLGAGAWEAEFDLTWELSLSLLEATYLSRDAAAFAALADELERRARTSDARLRLLIIRMHNHASERDFAAVLTVGLAALRLYGMELPADPATPHIIFELLRTKKQLGKRSIADLRQLPHMTDERHLRIQQLLMTMTSPVYFIRPKLFPLIVLKMIQIALKYGHSPVSAYAFNVYGVLLCAALGKIDAGYDIGRFGLELLGEMERPTPKGKALMVFHSSIHHWKRPLREALPEFINAYRAAVHVGDYEYAALSSLGYCAYSFLAGVDLPSLTQRFDKYIGAVKDMRESSHLPLIQVFAQATANLCTSSARPYILEGDHWRSSEGDQRLGTDQDKTTLCVKHIVELQLAYLFGDLQQAEASARKAHKALESILGTAYLPVFAFYYMLTLVKLAELQTRLRRQSTLRKARGFIRKMRRWAQHCPANYGHKLKLMQAELARVRGDYRAASRLYAQAIADASTHEFVQEEALGYELAAAFQLQLENRKAASFYLLEAVEAYEHWGAKGKAQAIRQFHLALLPAANKANEPKVAAVGDTNQAFDAAALIKASKVIFSELDPAKLYKNLMDILIESAGCERGLIVVRDGDEWFVEAASDVNRHGSAQAERARLDGEQLPLAVFRYVLNSQQSLIVRDATADDVFGQDSYVRAHKVRSVLCIPLLRQETVKGILYLENRALVGSFTQSHSALLNVLAAQIAVSIDNSRLYASLERRVADRTSELSESLRQLRNAQAELIQAEKLVALGSMVAGVAHEINTPLGIGITVSSTLGDATRNITASLGRGLRRSELDAYLRAVADGVQMLDRNLALVANQVAQFKKVSVPTDDVGVQYFSPYEAIATAINGFKLQYDCSKFAISLTCARDLTMASFPEALTQIVYNMLKNALVHGFEPGTGGRISVTFEPDGKDYALTFSDNGKGIDPEQLTKIFDPFYTTARTVGHMGLGLHLVFNLVYQRLKGRIECNSKVGVGTNFVIKIGGHLVTRSSH